MATRRRSSVRESVEARGADEDVEMRDRPQDDSANAKDMDAEGDLDDEEVEAEGSESRDMYHTIGELSTYLCQIEEEYVSTTPFKLPATTNRSQWRRTRIRISAYTKPARVARLLRSHFPPRCF